MEQTQLVMLSCNVTVLTVLTIFWVNLIRTKQMNGKTVVFAILTTVLIAVLTIFLPNLIFNGSAYPFPDAGFYEQFIG